MPSVAVFGSLNHDLTVTLPRLPRPDETLRAHSVTSYWGGKGFNQAIAAARLGASVTLIGAVGSDAAGVGLRAALLHAGVEAGTVRNVPGPTGTALPLVTDDGEVAILIVPGANADVGVDDADHARLILQAADVLLVQGEVDPAASARAAALAREADTIVVVNTAPVCAGMMDVLELADVVIANREEATQLGLRPGPRTIVTLGPDGARVGDLVVEAFGVEHPVDPTGAGDAFAAAVAVALAEGKPLHDAVRMGNAAGALAVQVAGAEPSFPTRDRVDALVALEAQRRADAARS